MNVRRRSSDPYSLTHRTGHKVPGRNKVEAHLFLVNGSALASALRLRGSGGDIDKPEPIHYQSLVSNMLNWTLFDEVHEGWRAE
jgi:hypothetical protein